MNFLKNLSPAGLFLVALCSGCQTQYEEPEISLEAYQIEPGFKLEVVASEPFLEAPVAIDFDDKGRIWAVEMRGYMQSLTGESESMPNGVISIMEDLDGDGVTDHSKVFMEGLVLPRAIAHVYGGLLYAEPPNLWFVEIEEDKPGNRVLVDSLYAAEGNVEHQPNGLMMNIDNWIYNARSHFRYQRRNGVWIKEPTTFRGQWGITKDNFGRLYYNNNSTQIMGDYVLPNVLTQNPFHEPQDGLNQVLTRNQRVYPLHATLVNRGYEKGVLDADSMLVNVTSSCGPLVYRGGIFPEDYAQNAFVCAPEVNLIKRNFLDFQGPVIHARQAWEGKEFLAATDEGFRPVNLFNGPDGAMYVVDMHRGILQHGAYMTSYLRERLAERGLDKVIGMGRILKVSHEGKAPQSIPDFDQLDGAEMVSLLSHPNGWVRDRAQALMIHRGSQAVVEALKALVREKDTGVAAVHALYTLEGLRALDYEDLIEAASNDDVDVIAHALRLMATNEFPHDRSGEIDLINELIERREPTIDLYLATYLGHRMQRVGEDLMPMMVQLTERNLPQFYQDAVLGSIGGKEENMLEHLKSTSGGAALDLTSQLEELLANKRENKKYWIHEQATLAMDDRTHGLALYRNICAACHGQGGRGIEGLAPPLDNSEYITGPVNRLALVMLHGMKGPVTVQGQQYKFNAQMPGIAVNPQLSDQDITDLITYLSNAFGKSERKANPELIKSLREVKPKDGAFTEPELNALMKEE